MPGSDQILPTVPAPPCRAAGTTASPWTAWFTPGRFAALLGALLASNFAAVLCGFQTLYLRDFGYFSHPVAQYHREAFWRGELPLWNPLNSCGMPFLAQWNTLTLYPGSLIYLLLPLPWSLNLFCLLHLFAGGVGMYFLAQRWTQNRFAACVAGTLFVFSGFTLNCAMWPNNIAALGLMPWVVLLAQRAWQEGGRQLLLGALVGAGQMLAGAPEMILLTWATVAGLFLIDLSGSDTARGRAVLRAIVMIVIIAALSAIQLLPFLELMHASDRTGQVSVASWSMPSWGWANFFVPLFHSYRAPIGSYFQPGQDWIASYYMGLGGVVLAVVALVLVRQARVWWLALLVALGVALGLGENGFLYPALKSAFPQLSFMRFPVKFLILVNFALPLLAAFAVAALVEGTSRARLRTLLLVSGAAALVVGALIWFAHAHPARSENPQTTLWNGATRGLILAALVALLCGLRRVAHERSLRILATLVLLTLALDGFIFSPRTLPTLPTGALEPGLVKLEPAPQPHGPRAMLIRPAHDAIYATMISDPLQDFVLHRQALFGNANLYDRLPTPDGFFSLYVKEQRQVWSQLWFQQTNWMTSPLLDFLGVAHINTASIFDWTNRATALPLATIGQAPIFADAETTVDGMLAPGFDPKRMVYLPVAAQSLVRATSPVEAKILSAEFTAHRLVFKVSAAADTLLVLSQTHYAPWQALVNQQPAPLLRANHAFQAVPIPAGTHDIVIEYRDRAFRLGAFITGGALLLVVLLWFVRTRWL